MRSTHLVVTIIAATIAAACGSSTGSHYTDPSSGTSTSSSSGDFIPSTPIGSSGADPDAGTSGGDPSDDSLDIDQSSLRIDPPDAVLTAIAGKQITQAYKIFGKIKSAPDEKDLTARFVFWVPDNFLVGGFPLDGGPVWASRLPKLATDPPQRAGKLTVQARARNSGGEVKITTTLTVKMTATLDSPNTFPSIPVNPEQRFNGPTSDMRKPELVYPNDGVMLPPNVRRLEVHWRPGSPENTLYELRFSGALADIVYYSRCSNEELKPEAERVYITGACAFELDGTGYGYLAESNRGNGPVKLRIRGTDDAGTAVGSSAEFTIEFAESRVDGGLYYWQTTAPVGIMRFDFGSPSGNPEPYVIKDENPKINQCPGCHALSRDGKKLVGSLGGQDDGRLFFINNLETPKTSASWLTVEPNADNGLTNRIQFASWSPDSTKFVAVYGDRATTADSKKPADVAADPNTTDRDRPSMKNLWFYDGTTGLRTISKTLAFKPNHPDWSPDGNFIAVTRVGDVQTTTQRPKDGSIEILQKSATDPTGFGDPVSIVPFANGLNRYNPNFVPDSSFLYYSESSCADPTATGDANGCDGDADLSATTWVVKPLGGAPIHLANAAKPGVADNTQSDGKYHLGDTFPRSAPFKTPHRGGQLFWFTVASRRTFGLRKVGGAQHLWMFAVDPSKVMAGQDGSYPGFYLPFQDISKSNHIGQWTEKVVGGSQPPPEPPPTAPPVPEPPPIVIK